MGRWDDGKCDAGENHRDIPEEEKGMLSGWLAKGLINACGQEGGEVHALQVRQGGVWSGAGTLAGLATAAPRQHRSRGAGPTSWAPAYHTGRPPPSACSLPSLPTDGDAP